MGATDTIRLLLDAKADLDSPDDIGMGPLHCAAEDEHEEAIRVLLQYGADTTAMAYTPTTTTTTATTGIDTPSAVIEEGGRDPASFAVKGGPCHSIFYDSRVMFWNLAAKAVMHCSALLTPTPTGTLAHC